MRLPDVAMTPTLHFEILLIAFLVGFLVTCKVIVWLKVRGKL